MRRFLMSLTVATLLSSPVLAQTTPATTSTIPALAPVSTPTTPILLGGQLTTPRSFVLADLQALSSQEVSLTCMAAGKSVTYTFKGVLLSDLLTADKPGFDSKAKNVSLS